MGQKEPPRLGSTICYGQELARKSHQDSAVRFVTAKRGPEKASETRQYDLLRPNVGQKEPPRLGSTTKRGPERATKTRHHDLLRPRVGNTICYGQELARKSHQDSAIRFVTAKSWREKCQRDSAVRFVTAKSWPEKATKTRQYDLLRSNVGQKEPPRLGSRICYGQTWARKSHQDSAVRFVTTKSWPEGATKTRQYDLLRLNVGQKKPPRLGNTICYSQELARKSHQHFAVRFVTANSKSHQDSAARKSHQDSAVQFVTAKRGPDKATETRQ